MRLFILAGAALAASSTLVLADPQSAPAPAANPAPAADAKLTTATNAAIDPKKKARDEQVICEEELETGSHLHRHRVCMTRADREKRQQESRDAMQGVFDSERGVLPPKTGLQ